ncbi:MAG TPA: sugar phosphate isomerase/epimerase family protein [Lachnospiraceae bacterium]|nr:sugar phosphate isomerase/epimerase family protein [Lachnospiraceae bacterium]
MESQFIISGFSDEISSNFKEQLREIKALNIAYIEIRGVNGKNIKDHTLEEVKILKKDLDQAGIEISAIGSPIGKINIKDAFEPEFDSFKHIVEIAKILETNYIRIFSFYMKENETIQYRDEVMKRLKQMTEYVKGTDIILLHENEKGIFGDVPQRCLDIVTTIDSPNLKLIFDPANFVQCQVKNYPDAFNTLKDHVIYYHMKDAKLRDGQVMPVGYGDGNLKELIQSLDQSGFHGFLSLEPHLGQFTGFENLEGNGISPKLEEKSDVKKFQLAYQCLQNVIKEVQNESN